MGPKTEHKASSQIDCIPITHTVYMPKNKHWQTQSTVLETAQATGFLEGVYKIYKSWQLEDVNLKTKLCCFSRRTSCISLCKRSSTATCKKWVLPHEAGTQQAAPQPEAHGPSHRGRPGFLCLSPQTSASKGELRPGYFPPHSSTTGPQHTAAPTAHPAPHSADARQRLSRARGQIPFASRTGVRAPTPKPPFPPGGQCPRARAAPPGCSPSPGIPLQ